MAPAHQVKVLKVATVLNGDQFNHDQFNSIDFKKKVILPKIRTFYFYIFWNFYVHFLKICPKAFAGVINRICKANLWLHIFTTQLSVFDKNICLISVNDKHTAIVDY